MGDDIKRLRLTEETRGHNQPDQSVKVLGDLRVYPYPDVERLTDI